MAINEFSGEFRWLSNFWPAAVSLDDNEYSSVEHAYQAAKTVDRAERDAFATLTAGQAKRYGREVTLRPDWNEVKLQVMEDLVRQKFRHDDLKCKLIATGDEEIIEGNNWGDRFWGTCDGKGQNHLGCILMQVRDDLKEENMLITCTISELKSVNADIKLAITRKEIKAADVEWVPDLAPSPELFSWYQANKQDPDWWNKYKFCFHEEKLEDTAYWKAIKSVVDAISNGYSVAIACFCADETKCHRSLVRKDIERITSEEKGGDKLKIVIFGSRDFDDMAMLKNTIEATKAFKNGQISDVISGMADGADSVGMQWAENNSINVIKKPAAWRVMTPGCRVGIYRNGGNYNKDAGHIRNIEMADIADLAMGFWNFKSPGTGQMVRSCIERRLPLIVVNYLTGEIFGSKDGSELKPIKLG